MAPGRSSCEFAPPAKTKGPEIRTFQKSPRPPPSHSRPFDLASRAAQFAAAIARNRPRRLAYARQIPFIPSQSRLGHTILRVTVAVARKIEWRGAQDRMAPRPWRSRGAIFYPAGRERYRFVRRAGPACRLSRVRGDAAPPTWPSRPLRPARAPDEIALRAELEHARLDRPGHIVAVAKSHLCQANPVCAIRSCGLQGPWLARGLGFA